MYELLFGLRYIGLAACVIPFMITSDDGFMSFGFFNIVSMISHIDFRTTATTSTSTSFTCIIHSISCGMVGRSNLFDSRFILLDSVHFFICSFRWWLSFSCIIIMITIYKCTCLWNVCVPALDLNIVRMRLSHFIMPNRWMVSILQHHYSRINLQRKSIAKYEKMRKIL